MIEVAIKIDSLLLLSLVKIKLFQSLGLFEIN